MSQPTNQQEFDRASQVLVGGVNSAVRAFRAVGGTPRFIQRAEGARMWDVEGKAYIATSSVGRSMIPCSRMAPDPASTKPASLTPMSAIRVC